MFSFPPKDSHPVRLLDFCLKVSRLNGPCYTSGQCAGIANASCYIFGKEYDVETSSGFHNVGPHLRYWPIGQCKCKIGFAYNLELKICQKSLIGSWCSLDKHCWSMRSLNAICDKKRGECECAWGTSYNKGNFVSLCSNHNLNFSNCSISNCSFPLFITTKNSTPVCLIPAALLERTGRQMVTIGRSTCRSANRTATAVRPVRFSHPAHHPPHSHLPLHRLHPPIRQRRSLIRRWPARAAVRWPPRRQSLRLPHRPLRQALCTSRAHRSRTSI